jgi:pyruvate-formate lyase-activating enzyme
LRYTCRKGETACRIHRAESGGSIITVPNPLTSKEVADAIKAQVIKPDFVSAVSVTGGEPLEQVAFVEGILLELKGAYKILLETNGTLAEPFKRVKDLVDIVSMDIKLPSVSGMGALGCACGTMISAG